MDFAIPGAVIAERYRLTRPLGAGSSAIVWEALDTALGRMVAVKLLRGGDSERLRREAHALARLAHPRIVTVFDYLDTVLPDGSGQAVLVTELVNGTGLDERLESGPPLGVAETLRVGAQLADALRMAHQVGIIHRDLKPGNVMLVADGVKLLDFGIAQAVGAGSGSGSDSGSGAAEAEAEAEADPQRGMAVGTPACMAPEQLTGQGAVPASDVYALGCLLYWCLTGRPPFDGTDLHEIVAGHLHAAPPPLDVPGLPPQIIALFQQCLAKDPMLRPSAGAAFGVLSQPLPTRIVPAHQTMVMPAFDVPPPPHVTAATTAMSSAAMASAGLPGPGSPNDVPPSSGLPNGGFPNAGSANGGLPNAGQPRPDRGYPEQPVFAPLPEPHRWTSPARLAIGAVLVAAVAAGVTAFAMSGTSQNTAATGGAGTSASSSPSAPASAASASASNTPSSTPASGPISGASPTNPGGDPIGYLETMRAQIQDFIGQGTDVIDPTIGGDLQNAVGDLENAVTAAQSHGSSKNQHNVQSKVSALNSKISNASDDGRISQSAADALTNEVQAFSDAFNQGGG